MRCKISLNRWVGTYLLDFTGHGVDLGAGIIAVGNVLN